MSGRDRAVALINAGKTEWIRPVGTQADLPLNAPVGSMTVVMADLDSSSANDCRQWVKVSATEWTPITIITRTPEMRLADLEKRMASLEAWSGLES